MRKSYYKSFFMPLTCRQQNGRKHPFKHSFTFLPKLQFVSKASYEKHYSKLLIDNHLRQCALKA